MSFRLPRNLGAQSNDTLSPLEAEVAAEKAASLGHAGRKVEACLAALEAAVAGPARERSLIEAAEAVQDFFIQREACGLRDHRAAIETLGISSAILTRLGARPKARS